MKRIPQGLDPLEPRSARVFDYPVGVGYRDALAWHDDDLPEPELVLYGAAGRKN